MLRWVLVLEAGHRRGDHPRCDGVHRDPVAAELQGELCRARDDRYRPPSIHLPAYESVEEYIDGRWKLDNGGIVVQAENEARRKELVMDINGAKALKKRLSRNGADEAPPAAEPAAVPADAPPVFHWTGKAPPATVRPEAEDEIPPQRASLFSRLSFGFR